MDDLTQATSTKPYFLRAIYQWCTDNGFTPYLAVKVQGADVQVPQEYVNNGEIVLNVAFDATSGLDMGNDYIRFQARFSGVVREIIVPVDAVFGIYAKENGQGMAFPVTQENHVSENDPAPGSPQTQQDRPPASGTSGAGLHLVPPEGNDHAQAKTDTQDDDPEPPTPPGSSGKTKKPTLRLVK